MAFPGIGQDVLLRFRTQLDLKGLVELRQEMVNLGRAGVKVQDNIRQVDNRIKRLGVDTKRATGVFRGFQAQFLSVLFLGMALSRMFSNLLKPAAQNVGIFELWTQLLGIVFLPIMLALLPLFLKMMDFFLNLDPSIQMAMGVFVIFMIILGKFLLLVGILALGWFGLIQVFPAIIGILASIVSIGFLPLIGIILAVIAIIVLLVIAFKTNFLGIKDVVMAVIEGIINVIKGIILIFQGFIDIIVGIFTGDWKKVWEGVKKIFKGAWLVIVKGLGKIALAFIKFLIMLPIKLAVLWLKFVAFMLKTAIWLWVHRAEWIPKVINAFKELGKKMITWAKDIAVKIWEAIIAKITALKDFGKKLISGVKRVAGGGSISTPSSQIGGIVPRTGVRLLHEGERVIPSSQNINFNPSVIVNVGSGTDATGIADVIRLVLNEQFARGVGDLSRR